MKPDSAADIVRKLREHGHEAFFVGGCVRDMVLGIEPADYDIATSAHPEAVIRIFPRTECIGVQFGVVLVIYRGYPFEVATFRSDAAYIDGRRPTGVVFTNAREDVFRRDFTINGLLYDPETGQIIDYVGGQDDIKAKIVRAIGDPRERFEEDKLRVLRAVRFGARLGYTIEEATWSAAREIASRIHQVSSERIRGELVRILREGDPARGVRLLEESGLLREILPELEWNSHLDQSLLLLKRGVHEDFAVGTLLHETPVDRINGIVERLKFSRAQAHHIVALAESLPRFSTVQQMAISSLKRFFRIPRFEEHLELARIHALAGDRNLANYNFAHQKYIGWSREDIAPSPLISGEHLIAMGLRPGPLFKDILTQVEEEQLEGRLTSHAQAMEWVRAQLTQGSAP